MVLTSVSITEVHDSDSESGIDLWIRVSTQWNRLKRIKGHIYDTADEPWLHDYRQCSLDQWARIRSCSNNKQIEHQMHDVHDTRWIWHYLFGMCYSVCFLLLCGIDYADAAIINGQSINYLLTCYWMNMIVLHGTEWVWQCYLILNESDSVAWYWINMTVLLDTEWIW